MTIEHIQRRKIYHEVLDRLLLRIRAGEWGPGDQLPSERDLMEAYGVGRPAVREAMQAMERSGIVEILHGERARVVVPTADLLIEQIAGGAQHLLRMQPDMLGHMKDARLFLETGLCRQAAERATPDDIARLRQRLDDHRAALVEIDLFVHNDMMFHREIANIAGNPIFPAIVEALFSWASEYHQTIVRAPGAEQITLEEHQRIFEAIAANDPVAATEAMHDHLTRANVLYQTAVQPPQT
ncbi:MAG: transcriptional regulator NanR [Rhodoferax sp.]|nr:transcriptional regulator NanR [Rhodoferax sp.]